MKRARMCAPIGFKKHTSLMRNFRTQLMVCTFVDDAYYDSQAGGGELA